MRIMIVDDNPADIELIERSLAKEFKHAEFAKVVRSTEFDEAPARDGYDLILTDYRLAWTDGLTVLKNVRSRYPGIPVIIVTDSGNEEVAVEAMRTSLTDYILKNHLDALPRRAADKMAQARAAREHDEAEAALRAAEERYRAVSELTTDYAFAFKVSPTGKLKREWITAGVAKVTGYPEEELSDKIVFTDLTYPPDKPRVEAAITQALKGTTVDLETRFVCKDGTNRWLRYFLQPVWNLSAGRVERILGGARDITKEKEHLEAMQASEAKFRAVTQLSTAAIFIVQGTKYVFVNPAAEELTGYTPEEISKLDFWEIVHPDYREAIKKRGIARMKEEKVPSRYELPIVDKQNHEKWLDFSGTLITYEGRPAILGSAIDITENKQRQSEEKQRELDIRRAYINVLFAVTGGKLVIATENELKNALGEPLIKRTPLSKYEEIAEARAELGALLRAEFPALAVDDMVLAADEAFTNAIKHAGAGYWQVFRADNRAQVLIDDAGPGIDFGSLPQATLMAGFSTAKTLGVGFSVMLEYCERVLLATRPGRTAIILEMDQSKT